MSNQDPPGPFGRNERTVIRPNPGARRPVAPPAPAPAAPSAYAPMPAASAPAQGGYQPAPSTDDWVQSAAPRPAAPPPPQGQGRPLNVRMEELVAPNENPIMRAAGPLLLLLGRLRVALMRASFASLMEQVAEAIVFFEKDIRQAGIPEAQANTAKYILCATADDIVQNIPTEDRHVWAQYSMLSRFFGERIGGVRFFEELERAKQDPLVNYPLLELLHACLALGFQGMHRTTPNGQMTLQQIQRNLYETLRRVRHKVNTDLSPRWMGQALANRGLRYRIPAWAVGAVAALLLFGLFITLRTLLSGETNNVAMAAVALHPLDQVAIQRRVFAPPPPPPPPPVDRITQLQRIRKALASDISAGKVSATQNATHIFIRVGDVVLFAPGQATVKDDFKPVAERIAATLDHEPGYIKVVGHSDSTPIKNVKFPTNWHLSVERAKNVGALMKQKLAKPGRIETEGKGSDVPIASNATAEGRARNRRVDMMIPRTD